MTAPPIGADGVAICRETGGLPLQAAGTVAADLVQAMRSFTRISTYVPRARRESQNYWTSHLAYSPGVRQ
jgi:hypothetical protein